MTKRGRKMKVSKQMMHDWKHHPVTEEVLAYLSARASEYESFGKDLVLSPKLFDDEFKAKIYLISGALRAIKEITSGNVFDSIVEESEEPKDDDSASGV